MTHVHLIGGPNDGEKLQLDLQENDIYPDMIIIPTSQESGELYEIAEEDSPCGFPRYLYSGYDWESVNGVWDESEE